MPATKRLDDGEDDEIPEIETTSVITRRSYGFQRTARQFMMNISYALVVIIVFYVLIRYVVKPDSALHRADKSVPHPSQSAD
jgi:hypothetical protein